jgi:hypothetical protein
VTDEKEVVSETIRLVWDHLGCFRAFDVRLLFGRFGRTLLLELSVTEVGEGKGGPQENTLGISLALGTGRGWRVTEVARSAPGSTLDAIHPLVRGESRMRYSRYR